MSQVATTGEVDLNQLSEQLVAVVEETMQPTYVSLWVSKAEKRSVTNARTNDSSMQSDQIAPGSYSSRPTRL
jgi:hypothetical protein